MGREIKLSGGEITVLKQIGFSGTQVYGKFLLENVEDVERVEFIETMTDLIDHGYVLASKVNVRDLHDVQTAFFRIAPAFARDLREAITGRKREEHRGRRERRG